MKNLITTVFLACSVISFGQQNPLSSFFWNNDQYYSPAKTGLNYKHKATATYRNQWDGINGAPGAIFGQYGYQINDQNGLGVNLLYTKIGYSSLSTGMLNYAYHLRLKNDHKLSFGGGLGITSVETDGYWITPQTGNDPYIVNPSRSTALDTKIGVNYSSKKLSVGLGMNHLLESSIPLSSSTSYNLARHFYFDGKYDIQVVENLDLTPQILFRSDFNFHSFDVNLLATLKNKYWLGISYRTEDAIIGMIGWDIFEKYRVGYAYDHPIKNTYAVTRGSHEITLGFLLK